ncbi:MAG: molybdate ABC transporter substrate-binding protein [Sulfurimonas sp.]|jgi:molybdate transport system substrate-binding protein|nr:molybdate ABC transporter substrate-binding protein [Sulfurimonas sp.]
MMLKKLLASMVLGYGVLYAGTINIAVAANVSYAMDELKAEFAKTNPDTNVRVTLGSSGKLTAQIKNGAPYTLFMAANMKYPQALYDDKIAVTKPVIYAQGALAYLSIHKRDFSKGIALLAEDTIGKIAIANPQTAPYGKAALEAMKKAKIYESVEPKFVYAESISQTVSYAVTAADIGLIAKSSLYSDTMKHYEEGIHWASVDPTLYTPINQGIVILKNGANNPEVKAFYDFILSQKAKEILVAYGYIVE